MRGIRDRMRRWKGEFHGGLPADLGDPAARRRAQVYVDWIDHGVLRKLWHNLHEVAPGVWRSNHPDDPRLALHKAAGFRTILSLRGGRGLVPHRLEEARCRALGLELVTVPMASRMAPTREALMALIAAFDRVERPLLMHCKSGADRTSLAAAIYLIEFEGATLAEARRQMSPRFLHFRWTRTGVLDRVLDFYEARLAAGPVRFRDWVAEEYDAEAVTRSFAARRSGP